MFVYATSVTGRVGGNDHRLFLPQINTNYGKQFVLSWSHIVECSTYGLAQHIFIYTI